MKHVTFKQPDGSLIVVSVAHIESLRGLPNMTKVTMTSGDSFYIAPMLDEAVRLIEASSS